MTLNYILKILESKKDILLKEYGVKKLGLFGSYVANKQTNSSDIDFLVEFVPGITDMFDTKSRLKEYLQSLFHKDVDLARSKYLKPYVKREILNSTIYAI